MPRQGLTVLIIGIGNPDRGDDAVGRLAAQRLRAQVDHGIEVLETESAGPELMDLWKDAEQVILIDAIDSGANAGTIHCLDASHDPLPAVFSRHSTHAFSIAETIELARTLGNLPSRVTVYGVEGKQYEHGRPLSPEVEQAMASLVRMVRTQIGPVG